MTAVLDRYPLLMICHSCEARGKVDRLGTPPNRQVVRSDESRRTFMDRHVECIERGWGNRL